MKGFNSAIIFGLIVSGFLACASYAQSDESAADANETNDDSNIEVEALYDKLDQGQDQKKASQKKAEKKQEQKEMTTLSELSTLAPFTDIAVIQRRFLPRTGRFELSGSGMTLVNNPFFNNIGLGVRAAYFLSEKHGIELQYLLFSNSRRSVTTNLEQRQLVRTTNLVTPKNYMGAAYKWTPMYGKITFLNHQIIPFDLSFTVGGGMTQTEKQGEATFHIGTGQAFALSKGLALRWDFLWNFYNAESDSATGAGTSKSSHSDLFLSAGVSFFLPEAKYR